MYIYMYTERDWQMHTYIHTDILIQAKWEIRLLPCVLPREQKWRRIIL